MKSRLVVVISIAIGLVACTVLYWRTPESNDASLDRLTSQNFSKANQPELSRAEKSPPKPSSKNQREEPENVIDYVASGMDLDFLYRDLMKMNISDSDINVLASMLEDDKYRMYWKNIVGVLGLSKNSKAVPALIDHIYSYDSWYLEIEGRSQSTVIFSKLEAIALLGHFELQAAEDKLKHLITESGAREVADIWGDDLPTLYDSETNSIAINVRANAATGLVITEKKENIGIIEQYMEDMKKEVQEFGAGGSLSRDEVTMWIERNLPEAELYGEFANAMQYRDIMQDFGGMEEMMLTAPSGKAFLTHSLQYATRYSLYDLAEKN